jgi:glycyl-radical enzyme activating protein
MQAPQGLIFDIQRCSLHDGPGIRTTVFFKGCPLRCVWCHNPESVLHTPEIGYRQDRCHRCGACAEVCEQGAHQVTEEQHLYNRAACIVCEKCVSACPAEGLRKIGDWMTVDQVLTEVELDRAYYQFSGGGMTLSGGEPMLQFPFTLALLQTARQRDLHTCLETCGHSSEAKYGQVLPFVDLFLFDYKATDPELHQRLTGVSNHVILSNLDFLLSNGAQVVLRCPLVPGFNDDAGHLAKIAELSQRYPQLVGIELMAYHELGREKALQVGRAVSLEDVKTTESSEKDRWLAALQSLGCLNAKIG